MTDPSHFWHDMVEGIIIWEGDDAGNPIDATRAPNEAEAFADDDAHVDQDPMDAPESSPLELADAGGDEATLDAEPTSTVAQADDEPADDGSAA